MTARRQTPALFMRWLWLVYVPLGFLLALFILFLFDLLPKQAIPALILLGLWGVLAVRLLLERRRLGIYIPPPRSMIFWIAGVTGTVLMGGVLFWVGAERVSSDSGLIMVAVGSFLMIFSVAAPALKLLDSAMRRLVKLAKRIASKTA